MYTKSIASGYGKDKKWVVTPNPGAPTGDSIPLLLVVRDILGYAKTAREAKRIITDGMVLVDKKTRRDPRYGVGLMDMIEIPAAKRYFRVMPGKKGLFLKEIDEKESKLKLCKIINKTLVKNGAVQLNLHDGSNLLVDKDEYKTKDSLLLELPKKDIKGHVMFKDGNTALVVKGRHSGEINKINEVLESTTTRKSLSKIGDLQTLTKYMFVIGEKEPLIKV